MAEELIGTIDHYFARIAVAGIALYAPLRLGDRIRIRGHTTDFEQTIDSMQIENERILEAEPGSAVGIKVVDRCRVGDEVYRIN